MNTAFRRAPSTAWRCETNAKRKKKKEKNSNLCTGGKVVLGRRSTTLEPCNFESWNKIAIEGLWNRQLCSLEVGQFEVCFNTKSNYGHL